VLILFVALFTVILAMAAYSIDQGLWYGKRRVAQKDADTAARSGAIALLGDNYSACEEAARTAVRNGVTGADPGTCGNNDGTATTFTKASDCVTAQINHPVGSLFARAFGVTGIDVGAQATACVGAVHTLWLTAPEAIPIVLKSNDTDDGSCFSSGSLQVGVECTIFGDTNTDPPNHPRLLASTTSATTCKGGGAPDTTKVTNGMPFLCTINTTGSCGANPDSATQCLTTAVPPADDAVFIAMRARFGKPLPPDCADDSFKEAYGYGDGFPEFAQGPEALGGIASDNETVFVRNKCFGFHPRIAVLPITDGTAAAVKPVTGFAVVYITGCTAPAGSGGGDGGDGGGDGGGGHGGGGGASMAAADGGGAFDKDCANTPTDTTEIRGVPLWIYLPDGGATPAGIDDPRTTNAPLTIFTKE
jgi:hypothetical protein